MALLSVLTFVPLALLSYASVEPSSRAVTWQVRSKLSSTPSVTASLRVVDRSGSPLPGLGWAVTADVPSAQTFVAAARLRAAVLSVAAVLTVILLGGLILLAYALAGQRRAKRALVRRQLPQTQAGLGPVATVPAEGPASTGGATVLLVDDNEVDRRVAAGMLERLGHRVQQASDGAAAVRAVESGGFDLVLMDCQLPTMDGFQATAAIRRLAGPAREVPIVAMTASATADDEVACRQAGMNGCISKPMRLADVADALERHLRLPTPAADASVPLSATSQPALTPDVLADLQRLDAAVPGTLLSIVTSFASDSGADLATLDEALRAGDTDAATSLAHRLKGSAANLAAGRVADRCGHLEDLLRAGDLTGGQALLPVLRSELADAIAALQEAFHAESATPGDTGGLSSRNQRPSSFPMTF